ncbi:hypothetical protein SAMN04488021_11140 [Paracoccus aminovorans]|uniref:Uncharacterized protein n=1 Tax=Paracoccus aminovorans TaxID=34004 RepID=A0A1I2ZWX9_9RHOB|nr:hypothetical protein [Paracoccus aminovorans]CQR84412.1 hypothetical protein JCM7685_pAMV3p0467 [Paracoccus aminovorans]SFH42278.1 hypothetical protein SAMN04488021_11140 [Paracoccus aminovorans]
MFRINTEGLVVDAEDDQPVAHVACGFLATEATMQGQRYLILRLNCQDDAPSGALLSSAQLHQFALPLDQAGDLVRAILEIANRSET